MTIDLNGLVLPPVTPFKDAGIDEKALAMHLEYLAQNGVTRLLVNGTTAEFFSLLPAERKELLLLSRKHFHGTILFNTASDSLLQAKDAARWAEDSGADAIVAMAPYYYSNAPEQGIIDCLNELADSVSLPLILYNFTKHTNNPLTAEVLRAVPHLAVKDSSGDQSLIDVTPCYLAGTSTSMLEWIRLGAEGFVSAKANFLPELYMNLEKAIRNGDMDSAEDIQIEIRKKTEGFKSTCEISGIKKELSNLIPNYPVNVRFPLL